MALFLPALTSAIDANGSTLSGATWEFYSKGTTTPQALAGGATSATSDANGEFSGLLLNDAVNYRAVLRSSAGAILYDITSVDNALFSAGVKAALDVSGNTQSGATWSFFNAGSSTPRAVYADPEITVSLGSVVEANAAGQFPEIYLDTGASYKAVLTVGGVVQSTLDPVTESSMGTFLDPTFIQNVAPSGDWNGTAGTGFSSTPTDPTRTTAKPALRLITPPHQAFTDTLLVGVYAGANNAGSLLTNMGLTKVTFHYEGTSLDVTAPSIQTFADVNGNPVSYFGWWANLEHNGTNGLANLYVEAVPADGTMQNRVIGPFRFAPSATLFDKEITVAPSQAVVAGSRYQSLRTAIDYLLTNNFKRPRITITEAGNYDCTAGSFNYTPDVRLVIDASVSGVVIKRAAYDSSNTTFNTRVNGIEWRGSNISIDFANFNLLERSPGLGSGPSHWLNGCNVIRSTGRQALQRGLDAAQAISATIQSSDACVTECSVSVVPKLGNSTLIFRGNTITGSYNDQINNAGLAIGNTLSDIDASWFANELTALTFQYTGAGATATLEMSGSHLGNNRLLNAKVNGSSVGTFNVLNTAAGFVANTNYTVQNVVDWINSLTDWTATLVDNTRAACALQPEGTEGPWGPIDAKTAAQSLSTAIRIHGDIMQTSGENYVFADNAAYNTVLAQHLFMKDGNSKDVLVINNLLHETTVLDQTVGKSQLAEPHSHVVWAHNTGVSQGVSLRSDIGYTADAYCLFACNVFPSVQWLGTPDADLVIKDNHLFTGASIPSGATGTTTGGSKTSWAVDPANGDFTPAGELLTNLKTPVVARDHDGVLRGATAPAGGLVA